MKKKLYKNIKRDRKILKNICRKSDGDLPESDCAEQLRSEYYLVNETVQGCLKELEKLKKQKCLIKTEQGYPCCYILLRELTANRAELSLESIARLFKNYKPSFDELAQTELYLKCALLDCMAERCRKNTEIKTELKILRAVAEIDFQQLFSLRSEGERLLSRDSMYALCDSDSKNYIRCLSDRLAVKSHLSEAEFLGDILKQAEKTKQSAVKLIYEAAQNREKAKKILACEIVLPLILSAAFDLLFKSVFVFFFSLLPIRAILESFVFNRVYSRFFERVPPKIEATELPDSAATVITVTAILPDEEELLLVKKHLKELYLSCRNEPVRVCLLADLKNSKRPSQPQDKVKTENAERMIDELNREFPNKFMMFVRRRVYVRTQGDFSGRERKRGALEDFAEYIKSDRKTILDKKYLKICGAVKGLEKAEYLLALDSDTALGCGCLRELLLTALHPLNKAKISKLTSTVEDGYAVFMPEITTAVGSAYSTLFSRIMAGTGGTGLYDMRCSEKYFDVFGRATFTGKGLIDINAFNSVLNSRFKEERVLSHDILEGELLRTAVVKSAQVSDLFPSNENSYFARLHRWIRGDVQNLAFLRTKAPFANGRLSPMGFVSKYKISENVLRALLPVSVFAALLLAFLLPCRTAVFMIALSIAGFASGELYSFLKLLFSSPFSGAWIKYFGDALSNPVLAALTLFYRILLLPKHAYTAFDACCRALWRSLISKRRLLEWTTAAQAEGKQSSPVFNRYSVFSLLSGAVFILTFSSVSFLPGILFTASAFSGLITGRKPKHLKNRPTADEREYLKAEAYNMWRYYEKCCTPESNFLPDDNIQTAPVYKQAHRTSPSNIGLMLLSTLCARDLSFIDTHTLCKRVEGALDALDKMEKYRGNLYNWYDTKTLEALAPKFVSLVDSGNLLCCLTALRQGLSDYAGEFDKIEELTGRIKKFEDGCELAFMYNSKRNLFHIGYYPDEDRLSPSYYDMLMSESRLTGYYAIGRGIIPIKHWAALSRTATRNNVFFGPASWGGSMFEYFMPHLFLPVKRNTLLWEALKYCLYSQRKAALFGRIPFGISESGYYRFDANMNYQYKSHGVGRLKLDTLSRNEAVVSPYSTFLCLPFSYSSAMKNLRRLEEYDSKGEYGFFEALDFTSERCFPKKYQSVKSFMAHHIGMSIISIDNLLNDGIICRRFMSDCGMTGCAALLDERIARDISLIKTDSFSHKTDKTKTRNNRFKHSFKVAGLPQKSTVLSNGECSSVICENGAGFLSYENNTVSRYSPDMLTRPSGIFAFADNGKRRYSLQSATDREQKGKYYAKFYENRVCLFSKSDCFESEITVAVDEGLSCERRRIRIKNRTDKRINGNLFIYFEPAFSSCISEEGHRAFSKLFVTAKKQWDKKLVLIKRNSRAVQKDLYCACGFSDGADFSCCLARDEALASKSGVFSLPEKSDFKEINKGIGDCCVLVKLPFYLKPFSSFETEFFILADSVEENLLNRTEILRGGKEKQKYASAVIKNDGETSLLLTRLLFNYERSRELPEGIDRSLLWKLGIGGESKTAVLTVNSLSAQREKILYWAGVNRRLGQVGIAFDLIIICKGADLDSAKRLLGSHGYNRISVVQYENLSENGREYLYSTACFTVGEEAPENLKAYKPLELIEKKNKKGENRIDRDGFHIENKPNIPWCYCISNRCFGTLVSDKSLGFTFQGNSYLNKLSYWSNDTAFDNTETLYLKLDGKIYDLISLADVTFGNGRAKYEVKIKGISFEIEASVCEKGAKKNIACTVTNGMGGINAQIYYYLEPLLACSPSQAKSVAFQTLGSTLVLENRDCPEIKGFAGMSVSEGEMLTATVKSAFFGGETENASNCIDGCAAVGRELTLGAFETESFCFSLCFAGTENALLKLVDAELPKRKIKRKITVETGIHSLDYMLNNFLPNQIIDARLNMRSGFYQCSGAYGFRDQLQDSLALLMTYPERTAEQILRCAAVQFCEGDVLHWWHSANGRIKGIRSRYSDDALWLCYAAVQYAEATDDRDILFKDIPFLCASLLSENENERYTEYSFGTEKASLVEHLIRAVRHSVKLGEHSLVLMQGGDWNDGMNLLGIRGKGESVWLSQFAVLTLKKLAKLLNEIGRLSEAEEYEQIVLTLTDAIDRYAFSFDRYIRAFDDEGKRIGDSENSRCKIDIMTQSFACLCGTLNKNNVDLALERVKRELVDENHGIIKLLTPAFNTDDSSVGYISSYPEGVRENGGQYTHAAVWYIKALAQSGQKDEAFRLLQMINPLEKYMKGEDTLKTEPYCLCGDVLSSEGFEGRGNWSIYTGAAGWFYTVALGDILGLRLKDGSFYCEGELPKAIKNCRFKIETEDGVTEIENGGQNNGNKN